MIENFICIITYALLFSITVSFVLLVLFTLLGDKISNYYCKGEENE